MPVDTFCFDVATDDTSAVVIEPVFAWVEEGDGEYVPPRPAVPARKEGRKIVERERPYIGPRIARTYRSESGGGSEEAPAPQVLTDIGQAFGLLHGRVLLNLSDIGADGLPYAHVAGGERSAMGAEGKAMGGATLAATLVAAILRCEAMDREA